jgi:GNAT superfamily N-acetyltransferase
MRIRPYEESDWPLVWPIIRDVVQAADTFAYDPAMTEAEAHGTWIERPPGQTIVAIDDARMLGTAKMGANRAGPGSHISTASFMVAADARGQGAGKAMLEFALAWARERGFAGMQFNAVTETNRSAIRLYLHHGFTIVGTIPGAFAHPTEGRVGLHVMYCEF